jgi:putative endonuclease
VPVRYVSDQNIGASGSAREDGRKRTWKDNAVDYIYMYYFYVLQSKIIEKLYKGSTTDLKGRIVEHNVGKVKSTKSFRPWSLMYYEAYRNKTLARKAEIFYKSSQGRRQLKKKLGLE